MERLGTVERYFVEIKDIPRLGERIKCFIFTRTYASTKAKVGGQGWVGGAVEWLVGFLGACVWGWGGPGCALSASCALLQGLAPAAPLLAPPSQPGRLTNTPPAHPHTFTLSQCEEQLGLMQAACRELRDCQPFSKVLQVGGLLGAAPRHQRGPQQPTCCGSPRWPCCPCCCSCSAWYCRRFWSWATT